MTDQPRTPVPGPASAPVPGPSRAPVPGPPAAPVTGEARVDQALAVLAGLDTDDLAGHVDAFSEVHRLLQDALATLDGT